MCCEEGRDLGQNKGQRDAALSEGGLSWSALDVGLLARDCALMSLYAPVCYWAPASEAGVAADGACGSAGAC